MRSTASWKGVADNRQVTFDDDGWRLKTNPAEQPDPAQFLRRQTGIGTPRSLQGRAVSAICRRIGRLIDRWGRLTRAWGFKWTPTALVGSIAHRQAA